MPRVVPFRHPPFDHAAIRLFSLSRDSFHKEFAYTSAAVSSGNIEFLDD